MIVCMVNGFTYEKLAAELDSVGVSGYQKVDYNRHIALVFEDSRIRDLLWY